MPSKLPPIQCELWHPAEMMIIDKEIADIARDALPAINQSRTHDRVAIYAPDKIFSKLVGEGAGSREEKWEMDNYLVKAQLGRLFTFRNNQACVDCGIRGTFFLMERHVNESMQGGYSLVLYALDHNSNLVAMTVDHILPDSLGGRYATSNFQTMCRVCNQEKAHLMSLEEINQIRANVKTHAKDWVNVRLLFALLDLREASLKTSSPAEEHEMHQMYERFRKLLVHSGDNTKQAHAIEQINLYLRVPEPIVAPWYMRVFASVTQYFKRLCR